MSKPNEAVPRETFFQNYDLGAGEANKTSPGGGLYDGSMDKYKSVSDFLKKKRKKKRALRKKAWIQLLQASC